MPPAPSSSGLLLARLKERWLRARQGFVSQLPTPHDLARVRWLAPVAHHLADPRLWHVRSESLARGVAIGTFWAFAVPVGQIVLAAAHCVWWRGNIPVAAAITFITNPFTVGFWLYLGYRLGSLVVPGVVPEMVPLEGELAQTEGVLALLRSHGWPTLVGMGLFATGGAALGYAAVRLGSRVWFHWRVAKRSSRSRRHASVRQQAAKE